MNNEHLLNPKVQRESTNLTSMHYFLFSKERTAQLMIWNVLNYGRFILTVLRSMKAEDSGKYCCAGLITISIGFVARDLYYVSYNNFIHLSESNFEL